MMGQIELFQSYSYSIELCAEKNEKNIKITTQKFTMYNEWNSITFSHKITLSGWYAIKINQSIKIKPVISNPTLDLWL